VAYAVLPYVSQGAVEKQGWLGGDQMIDGLAALGESIPGSLIMVVTYLGFMGGWNSAAAAAQRSSGGGQPR
jgi:chromate transporter